MFKFLIHKYISCQNNDFFENQWNIHSDLFWVTKRKRDEEESGFFLGRGGGVEEAIKDKGSKVHRRATA